jgi:hypothetical protein
MQAKSFCQQEMSDIHLGSREHGYVCGVITLVNYGNGLLMVQAVFLYLDSWLLVKHRGTDAVAALWEVG